jgi:predicted dienelactone hydrolase
MKLSGSLSTVCRCASIPVMLVLVACTPATPTPEPLPQPTPPPVPTTGTEPAPFPLSERGPYHVGTRTYSFTDADRDGRGIGITVWYPAIRPADATGSTTGGADPDASGAPYPLILSSRKVADFFGSHLASHGFVVAGVNGLDYYIPWDENLIDQPLDILFALDQVASNPIEGLEGLIDAEHAGVMGYSFDGYNALAMSGARVDPEFYLSECASTPLQEHWIQFGYCNMSGEWDQFAAHAGDAITTSDDGLWNPITSERIRAVMPMAPEGAVLFGERGLSAVDRPTLIIGATEDVDCDYNHEAVFIFEHIGTSDKTLISFIGEDHYMVYEPEMVSRMKHFATAFFGYYLQGRDDYSEYFSEDFVSQHDDLAWGVYTE